jgi:hypothetical protein
MKFNKSIKKFLSIEDENYRKKFKDELMEKTKIEKYKMY